VDYFDNLLHLAENYGLGEMVAAYSSVWTSNSALDPGSKKSRTYYFLDSMHTAAGCPIKESPD
jgi:hypothetical protein